MISGRDKFTFNASKCLCMLYPSQTHKSKHSAQDDAWTRTRREYRGEDGISQWNTVELWD